MADRRRPATPVFLERPNYKRRRIADAARIVPVVGAVLVFLPLLWPREGEAAVSTASGTIYIFGIWALMIVAAAVLAPLLTRRDRE
ncbi:MAG: hypothetical protein AAF618_14190 [Pseudomonadota bacterium]